MTYAVPQDGKTVRVTTRFSDDYYKAENKYRERTYVGQVLPSERWFKADQFAITSDDERMPFRVLSTHNIVTLIVDDKEGALDDPNKGTRTVSISGSKGSQYVVTIKDGAAISCTCPGFTFRKTCRHLKEAVDISGKTHDNVAKAEPIQHNNT